MGRLPDAVFIITSKIALRKVMVRDFFCDVFHCATIEQHMNPISYFGDLIARWCVVLVVALLPIFVLPVSWVTVPQAKMLFVSSLAFIGLMGWFVARIAEGSAQVPRHILLWGKIGRAHV